MINRQVLVATIYDPGQDSKVALLRVPDDHVYTVEKLYAVTDRTTAAGTVFFSVQLLNGGTGGTVETAISAEVGGSLGWTANVPKTGAVTSGVGDLTAGQWLVAKYAETGAVTPGVVTLSVEYVDGIGSTA